MRIFFIAFAVIIFLSERTEAYTHDELVEDVNALLEPKDNIECLNRMGGGFANNLWYVSALSGKYVLRVPFQQEASETFEKAIKISKKAFDCGISPKVVNVNQDKQQVLLQYIQAEPWPAYNDHPDPHFSTMHALKRFHECVSDTEEEWQLESGAPYTSILKKWKVLSTYGDLPRHFEVAIEIFKIQFEKMKPWLKVNSCLCHGDFHKNNVLLQNKNGIFVPYLIDFDSAMWGHPYFDIAKFSISLPQELRMEIFKEYLGCYPDDFDRYQLEQMDLALYMMGAMVRYTGFFESEDYPGECLTKEEAEALMDQPLESKEFTSISFALKTAKMKQLGGLYALKQFLKESSTR